MKNVYSIFILLLLLSFNILKGQHISITSGNTGTPGIIDSPWACYDGGIMGVNNPPAGWATDPGYGLLANGWTDSVFHGAGNTQPDTPSLCAYPGQLVHNPRPFTGLPAYPEGQAMWVSGATQVNQIAYFREVVELPSYCAIQNIELFANADDYATLFINGVVICHPYNNHVDTAVRFGSDNAAIIGALHPGANVISIMGDNQYQYCATVDLSLNFDLVQDTLDPQLNLTGTSFCRDSSISLSASGGVLGQLFYDSSAVTGALPISSFASYILSSSYTNTLGAHTITFIVYSTSPDSLSFCSDTIYQTINIVNCNCDTGLFAQMTVPDSMCMYGYYIFQFAGNGAFGQVIDNGDSSGIMPIDSFLAGITIIPDSSSLGIHNFVFIVFADSLGRTCSAITHATTTVFNCNVPCDSLNPQITFTDTTFCVGDSFYIYFTGGPFAQVTIDSNQTPIVLLDSLFPGGLLALPKDIDVGTHYFRLTVYSSYPDTSCSKTVYAYPTIKRCNCNGYVPTMVSLQTGPMTWKYWSTSNPAPTFLEWFIDTTQVMQTTATDTFTYTFTGEGTQHVCMTAGYITPRGDGTSFCCYETTCDSETIDYCNIWRSTDSISYTLDSSDYHKVHFTYYGAAPTSMMWVFDNGDTVVNNGEPVTQTFTNGNHGVCTYLVWSLHDSTNCCCVDTICLNNVDVSPCNLVQFGITEADSSSGSPTFISSFAGGAFGIYTITVDRTTWLLNGDVTDSGSIFAPSITSSGTYVVGMIIQYTVSTSLTTQSCTDTVYESFNLNGREERPLFRVYPNPTGGKFLVQVTTSDQINSAKIELIDLTGRSVSQKSIAEIHKGTSNIFMDISNLPQGVYQLKMIMNNTTQVGKLIKQ